MMAAVEAEVPASTGDGPIMASWPFRFEVVPLADLHVDPSYQRPLTSFWKTVQERFNPALVGTLIVSERKSGKKSIIDGQTRWTAMKELALPAAPCLIYEGLSKTDEARLFAELQTQRRGMRSYDRFRAQLVARQESAVALSRVATSYGFDLGLEETANTVKAIAALEKALKYSQEHLEDVLSVIRDAWGNTDKTAVSAAIVNGLSHFLRYQEEVDLDRLVDRLQDTTPNMLIHRASALREGGITGGGATVMSTAILKEYQRRKRS